MLLKLGDDFNAGKVMAHCLQHLLIPLFRLLHLCLLTRLQRPITLALLVDERIQMSEETALCSIIVTTASFKLTCT